MVEDEAAALLGLLILCLTPPQTAAQISFDGTWKIDLAEFQPAAKPDIYLLQNGIYHCTTCDPPLEIGADGRDHKITGRRAMTLSASRY